MCRKSIHLISFVFVLATGGVAQAGLNDPPLLNESFEEETSWGAATPGWYDYDAGNSQWWAFQETRGDDPKTTYGDVWGALRPDGIHWQKIGTWDAGAVYQIDVLVGNRTTWTNGGIYISLWGGGNEASASDDTYPEAIGATKLSESDILITDEVGGVMETKEVSTILSTGTGLTPGDPLWIQIINANAQGISYFDYPRITLVKKASDAEAPNPAHAATDVPRNVVISWKPGMYADKHDVYLGTNFDDVNDADRANPLSVLASQNQDPNIYAPPERLAFGETYYWRIDEVNAAPDYTVFKGRVWQFTVEPVAYPIPAERITVTASSSMGDSSPEKAIDGSGLDDSDLHSTDLGDMWLSDFLGTQPTWIEFQFDKVYKLREMWAWNQNQVIEPAVGYGFRDVSIECSVDGVSYTPLGTSTEFAQAPGTPAYAHNTAVDFEGVVAKYVRLTANSNWGGFLQQYGLSEVRFFHVPVRAREPNPDSGATDVDVDATLSFRAGREAARHDVYLSADEQAVIDGNAPVMTVTETSYAPSLDLAGTYYWRIDEVNDAEIPTSWQGDIWNLSTQEYLVVDDFESYNDIEAGQEGSNLIYGTWADGFESPANGGSTIGYNEPFQPTMETVIVHGGGQSAPLAYNNTGAAFSEVTRTLAAQNWTEHGIQTLSLWFYGDSANMPGQLYVKINGVKVDYDGPAGNLAQAGWKPWNIDLTSVGADLQSVTSLAIGVEGVGATGTLLLDDIRLYPYPRELVTPVQPDPAGLVGHWKLDEGSGTTAQDSSGNGRGGTLNGNPQWVAGYLDGALEFDGLDDTLNFGTGPALGGTTDFSVAAWIKTSATADGVVIQQRNGGYNGEYRLRVNGTGVLNFMIYGGGFQFDDLPTTRTVNDGNWHHVMAVRQGGRGYIYIDGSLEASGNSTFVAPLDASIEVAVGADIRDGGDYFDGTIDDVRIYERPLSYAEIAGLAGRTQPFDKPF